MVPKSLPLSLSLPLLARDSITEEAKIGTMGRPRTSKISWEQRNDVKKNQLDRRANLKVKVNVEGKETQAEFH